MAAGDLITQNYQLEYNGLLIGNGTVWDITGIDGLDMISVREGDDKRPLAHGAMDLTPDLMPQRVIILRMNGITQDPVVLAQLRTATAVREAGSAQLLPLIIQLHDNTKYQINCRVRRRAIPIDDEWSWGFGNVTLMFWCPDPRFYSFTETISSVALPTVSGGFDFPVEFPVTFGGGSGVAGSAIANNLGDVITYPVATLSGPLTSPKIQNDTTGEFWQTSASIVSGQQMVVDFFERTAKIDGQTRYSTITTDSTWFGLIPGTNQLSLSGGGGNGSVQIAWRSAWHALV